MIMLLDFILMFDIALLEIKYNYAIDIDQKINDFNITVDFYNKILIYSLF